MKPLKACDHLSDKEIIHLSLKDLDYFACLYNRYELRLLSYISRISTLSEHEAEDIVQDAFIKVWLHIHDFDPELTFKSWIYRIVHNLTISHWRKNESRLNKHAEYGMHFQSISVPDIFEMDHSAEKSRMLNKAISKLSDRYREIIILKYYENMSYEEISDILKIPAGTVAIRINRAKKHIQKALGK